MKEVLQKGQPYEDTASWTAQGINANFRSTQILR